LLPAAVYIGSEMTQNKELEVRISDLIVGDLAAIGYELVRIELLGGGRYMTLQIMAERADGKPMTVNDCTQISHTVSDRLDSCAELADRTTLEVSSPGIDRPLVRLKDYERFTGHVARIELETPLDSVDGKRKRFQGSIVRVTGNAPDAEIEFRTETGDVRVSLQSIARARLVLTDALLNATGGSKH
jgi:ribosome maturation factor RimP